MQTHLGYALLVRLTPGAEPPDLDWGVVVDLVPCSPDVSGYASHEEVVLGRGVAIRAPRGVEVEIQVADVVFVGINGHGGSALEGVRVLLDSRVRLDGWIRHLERCVGFSCACACACA